jgi:hypothetical protein
MVQPESENHGPNPLMAYERLCSRGSQKLGSKTPEYPMAFAAVAAKLLSTVMALRWNLSPATARTTIANSPVVSARTLPEVNDTTSAAECANEKQVIPHCQFTVRQRDRWTTSLSGKRTVRWRRQPT